MAEIPTWVVGGVRICSDCPFHDYTVGSWHLVKS